jgi:hypothetical protein
MNTRKRLNMLDPLIRQARSRALAGLIMAALTCLLEVASVVLLVLRWRLDQTLNKDGQLPLRSLLTLLAPPVLTALLLLAGAWGLWHWSKWQGLRTEQRILETLADSRDNQHD